MRVRCVDLNSLSGTSAAERLRPRPKRVLSVPRGLVGAGASFLSAPCAASQAQLKQAVGNFFSKPKDVPPGVILRHGRLRKPTKPGEEEKKIERGRPKRSRASSVLPQLAARVLLASGRAASGDAAVENRDGTCDGDVPQAAPTRARENYQVGAVGLHRRGHAGAHLGLPFSDGSVIYTLIALLGENRRQDVVSSLG